MRPIDRDGLLLCELQAKTFELSVDAVAASSAIFIRRFMNSRAAKWLDSGEVLASNAQPGDLLDRIEEQYGPSDYGSMKYTRNEMYWMGYMYRYLAFAYELSSLQAYKTVGPKELRGLFLPYHTLDPAQAAERILEAKGIGMDGNEDLERQFAIYKRIRENKQK